MKKKMATITEGTAIKLINALTDAYCFLKGSKMGEGIIGKTIIERVANAIGSFHSEKMKMEDEKEWWDDSLNVSKENNLTDKEAREIWRNCASRENPSDYEY